MNLKFRFTATTFAFALLASACASKQPEPRDPSEAGVVASGSQGSALPDREATVQVSKALRDRCRLPEGEQGAPRFEFDNAALHAQGKNVLDDLALCLRAGPLKGEVVTIIGRADSRGTQTHNEELGATRAAAARNYLAQHGVAADRLKVMSRGEQGARGDDEAGHALDRRIDIELGDLENSPILEGSMLQAETSPAKSKSNAASYADTAEGGKPVTGAAK